MATKLQIFRNGSLAATALALAMMPTAAHADEGGASIYLLGAGVPGAAVMPPFEGLYFDQMLYYYDGSAGGQKDFVIGGNVVANVDAKIMATFAALMWVPSTDVAGGTLAISALLPVGAPQIDASAVITGPGGRRLDVTRHDSALVVADPLISAQLGWQTGKVHVALSGLVNVPVGRYREGQLANLSFHRWAADASLAASWHDPEAGWDVSGKAGVTFNGKNDFTEYDSGNDLHIEASVERQFSKKFSAGVFGYQLFQLSGDSGAGARLGSFKGQVTGMGATVAYNTVMGRSPATFRLRVAQEFWEKNRLQGTSAMLDLSLPLKMNIPPHE